MLKKNAKQDHYFSAYPKSKFRLGIIRTNLRGMSFEFLTASGVFSKKRVDLGTRLLIESMILPEYGKVLDLGCGYGAVGIAAAASNPNLHVVMVDINNRAVWLAKKNIEMNNINNAEVRHGHLYEPVKGLSFDAILSNPPVSAGMKTIRAMIMDAPRYMNANASFQMVVKSKIAGKRLHAIFEEAFGNVVVLARKSGYRVLIATKEA
ncbi:MAG: class I SAM-dependent methyltransferase [Candidatus Bathyarchaeia archaeon]